jgi:hypothetical protein
LGNKLWLITLNVMACRLFGSQKGIAAIAPR